MKTPYLDLTLLQEGAQGNETHVNKLMLQLDAGVMQGIVLAISNDGTPTDYNSYLVGAAPTGEFAGATPNDFAYYQGQWFFISPREGWRIYDQDTSLEYTYNGSAWVVLDAIKENPLGLNIASPTTFLETLTLAKGLILSDEEVTASTTQSQGEGPLSASKSVHSVTGVGDGDAVTLPEVANGQLHLVHNDNDNNGVQVFPGTGDSIGDQDANTPDAIPAMRSALYVGIEGHEWIPLRDAGSVARVFAYVSTPVDTVCILADTYYFFESTFTNTLLQGFGLGANMGILYEHNHKEAFEVEWSFSGSADDTAVITAALILNPTFDANGAVASGAIVGGSQGTGRATAFQSGYEISPRSLCALALESGDEVALVIKSDTAGVTITPTDGSASLHKFQ